MIQALRLWSRTRSAFRFARDALGSARQRALLALLGIAIGVAAVVTLVALGQGLERQAQEDFKAMGTQVIDLALADPEAGLVKTKKSNEPRARNRLKWDDFVATIAAMPEVELISQKVPLSCPSVSLQNRLVSAVSPDLTRILGLKLSTGRFIHALDGNDLWVVLGANTAQQLASNGQVLEPGTMLSLCGRSLRLAGVLERDNVSADVVAISLDDGILVSVPAGQRMQSDAMPNNLVLRVRPEVSPNEFAVRLQAYVSKLTGHFYFQCYK